VDDAERPFGADHEIRQASYCSEGVDILLGVAPADRDKRLQLLCPRPQTSSRARRLT